MELQKLQSTQVTPDLARHDPLMHDRPGGGSVVPRGGHLNESGPAEVWDSAARRVTRLQSCSVSCLGNLITPQEDATN